MGIDDDVDVVIGQQRNEIEANLNPISVELPYWKKGMKVKCPNCHRKVKEPYRCKCGVILKPFVKMSFAK